MRLTIEPKSKTPGCNRAQLTVNLDDDRVWIKEGFGQSLAADQDYIITSDVLFKMIKKKYTKGLMQGKCKGACCE